ncbi:MAG TPA: hypothetical protein VGM51_12855 [Armatimonadota bacterium]
MSTYGVRSSSKSRRRRGLTWERVGFAFARLALAAVGLSLTLLIASKLSHPYLLHWSENRSVAEDRQRRDSLLADNERLKRRRIHLKTPAGEIAQSRSLGYHFPDEHPVRVQEQAPAPATP